MQQIRVVVTNRRELDRQLQTLPKKIKDTLTAKALKRAALHMRDVIKLHTPVDEGDLEESIRAYKVKGAMIVAVGRSQMIKGKWLEYGTLRMQPHPFFWDAVASALEETKAIIETDAAKVLAEMGGRNG